MGATGKCGIAPVKPVVAKSTAYQVCSTTKPNSGCIHGFKCGKMKYFEGRSSLYNNKKTSDEETCMTHDACGQERDDYVIVCGAKIL